MKNVAKLFLWTFLIVAGVLLLMVLNDLVNPQTVEVYIEPDFIVYPETQDNWAETANALGVHPDSLTIEQFMEHDPINGYSYEAAQDQLTEHLANR